MLDEVTCALDLLINDGGFDSQASVVLEFVILFGFVILLPWRWSTSQEEAVLHFCLASGNRPSASTRPSDFSCHAAQSILQTLIDDNSSIAV